MSNEIVFTVSFVKAYEFQELLMGVGQRIPTKKID